jgi:hypothetical protein
MTLDLTTRAGVLRFCELRRAEMAGQFREQGRYDVNGYSFAGYVFATHALAPHQADPSNPKPGRKLERVAAELVTLPTYVADLFGHDPTKIKDFYALAVRSFAKGTRAIGTLMMTEMWYVEARSQGRAPDLVRDEYPESLEDADDRHEGLMMLLEHSATGRVMWRAEIKRNPSRLEPWEDMTPGDAEGRLVNLTSFMS